MFKAGKTIYHIDRVIRENGEVSDNGLQEIYVNAKIDDGSDIAELMRIFKEPDAYDFEKFPKVSKRKKQFKEDEGGDKTMCDLVENYANEKADAKTREIASTLFQNGADYDMVRASIPSLSDTELQDIYQKAKKA